MRPIGIIVGGGEVDAHGLVLAALLDLAALCERAPVRLRRDGGSIISEKLRGQSLRRDDGRDRAAAQVSPAHLECREEPEAEPEEADVERGEDRRRDRAAAEQRKQQRCAAARVRPRIDALGCRVWGYGQAMRLLPLFLLRRFGPVGFVLAVLDVWRRLPTRQRRWLVAHGRRQALRITTRARAFAAGAVSR